MWKELPPLPVFLLAFVLLSPPASMLTFLALIGMSEYGLRKLGPILLIWAYAIGAVPAALTGAFAWGRWRRTAPRARYLAECLAAGSILSALPLILMAVAALPFTLPAFLAVGTVGALAPTLLVFPAAEKPTETQ